MPRALLSVFDKTDLVRFATELTQLGWDLVASGGTERALNEAGLMVTPVEQLTSLPHMLGGRVKTLHPAIHAGILSRNTEEDLQTLEEFGYAPIEMVVCNLYPFQETVTRQSTTLQDAIEQIDIGGVTLLRAAAKNFFHNTVICDPEDYNLVLASLKVSGEVELALRRNLAVKAFAHTRDYDTAIHAFLSVGTTSLMNAVTDELPGQLSLGVQKVENLRYGENPHQEAAYYSRQSTDGPLGGTLLHGKELSYNNLLDIDTGWRAITSFYDATVVLIKHTNPIGIASGQTLAEACKHAIETNPSSTSGSVIVTNRPIDSDFLTAMGTLMVEAIAAPNFEPTARETLQQTRPNCHLLQIPFPFDGSELEIRSVHRGILVQRANTGDPEGVTLKIVTVRAPTEKELQTLQFAWQIVRHVHTNGVVIATDNQTISIAGGLNDRFDAVKLAIEKADKKVNGAVMALDAFLPSAEILQYTAEAGIKAIIQPGGSIRDTEVINAANQSDIAMLFTGIRHYRH